MTYHYEYYLEMVRETVRLYPSVMPHYWSAPEIWQMCDVSGKSPREVMQDLWNAGTADDARWRFRDSE